MIRPFFKYFGGKWRIAPKYPAPTHATIIEPFAGSAGYALRYSYHNVILADAYPVIREVWRYLIRVSEKEILALPDIENHQSLDDFPQLPQEAKWLIGFWLNAGVSRPMLSPSSWMRSKVAEGTFWGIKARTRIAKQLYAIRHWKVLDGSYSDVDNQKATWFIDPPYIKAGKDYVHSLSGMDYLSLADWCRSRQGQVIVCENEGAQWLPFKPFLKAKSTPGENRPHSHAVEAIWSNYPLDICEEEYEEDEE